MSIAKCFERVFWQMCGCDGSHFSSVCWKMKVEKLYLCTKNKTKQKKNLIKAFQVPNL